MKTSISNEFSVKRKNAAKAEGRAGSEKKIQVKL
jgi:hypothetical protein